MDSHVYPIFISKLNELCNLDMGNLVYSLIPSLDNKPEYMGRFYAHNINNLPLVLDCAFSVIGDKKIDAAKKSYPYVRLEEEKDNFLDILVNSKQIICLNEIKVGNDKLSAALAALSHIYLDSFIYPIQFFLPHSSVCSGQWDFWDKTDYLKLVEKIHEKGTIKLLNEKLLKSNVWKTKFKPEDFPEIVKRRLMKEKVFDKKLDSNALMKAIIIRMGELAKPSINYEVIDFSIRSFFTYLGVKQYLRVDREMLFLRRFEEEMKKILVEI